MAGYRPADWHPLDLDKDPTPGDPQRVRSLAKQLHDFADDVSDALRLVKGMAGEDTLLQWAGKSADVFKEQFKDVPKNLKKLKKSYELCGDALADYWPKLERAQALADKALAKAKEAQSDLSSAKSRLSSADSWVTRASKEADKYKDDPTGSKSSADKPDEAKVRAAARDVQSAKSAHTTAQSDVTTAQNALDAAKKMAEDARKMRDDAAGEAKRKIDEASDAGIPNRHWWQDVGHWFEDNWDTIVTVCKVVVAVVGIIALIIGGPILGAIVLIAALVVLADTLYKYSKGQASLWDVAFAALDCIPGGKGITSLGKIAKGLKEMKNLRGGMKAMSLAVRGLGKNARGMLEDGAKGAYNRLKSAVRSKGSDPIDWATGTMFLPETDVTLPGSLPLAFTRRAASDYRCGWWFGPSWASTIDQRLEVDEDGIVFVTEDGLLLGFPHPTAPHAPVLPAAGPRLRLSRLDDGGYRVEDPQTGVARRFGQPRGGIALLERISDRNGDAVDVDHADDGTPLALRHSGGYHLRLTVDDGRVTALHLAGAGRDGTDVPLRTYSYTDGCLTAVADASGRVMRLAYDDRHRITSWTDRNGRGYAYTYDAADRCVAEGGEAGHLTLALAYDGTDPAWPGARITTVATAEGAVSKYVVDDGCRVVAEVDPLGGTARSTWDEHHQLVSWTDESGHTTVRAYDGDGRLLSVVRPDGTTARLVYDEVGGPVELTRPDGQVTRRAYDSRGNCVAITAPGDATNRYTYDDAGHLSSVTDATGLVTRVRCDAAGRAEQVTDPLGGVTRFVHDSFGRVTAITDPLGRTTRMDWAADGELLRRTGPDGAAEEWTYDGEGNRTSHTDAAGAVTRFEYTHFNLLAARTSPDGVRHVFDYDPSLRLTGVSRADGRRWTYTYDAAGRLLAETDFDGRTQTYGHDARGQVVVRANALGEEVRLTRDVFGRTVGKDAGGRISTYAYDLNDRLIRAEGPDATVTLLRDPAGRVVSETVNGRTSTFAYDATGRPLSRTTPTGATSAWTYDGRGDRARTRTAGRTLAHLHDAAGQPLSVGVDDVLSLTRAYDSAGRVTAQSVVTGDGRTVRDRSYRYRADGHLLGIDGPDGVTRAFELDGAGRTTAVRAEGWTESYVYGTDGGQTAAEWPDGHPGNEAVGPREAEGTRVLRAGATRYRYDEQGRLVWRQRTRLSRKPDSWAYTWDAEDRLTSVRAPDGTLWRYRYDPMGRRIAKERLGADGTTVVERTDFTWDGTTLCEQLTTDGAQPHAVAVTWEHDGIRPLSQCERLLTASHEEIDARFFAIVTDLAGAPTELVDEEGRIAWHTRSTLWGVTAWSGGSSAYTALRFPGQYYDPESGLHYNFHRYYDPETARYLSPDPLGLGPSPNPFLYFLDPLLSADPYGLYEIGKPDAASQAGNLPLIADKIAAHGDIKKRGIPGVDDLDVPEHLEDMMTGSPGLRMRSTPSGVPRFAWWDDATGTMLIREGDKGTFMQPDDGYDYFLKQLKE
ncbi:RHS repeat-associated core domain-containing protein [Streptomyces sp. NPDC005917]|uniref:RHS repeat-associated core domain-containing protein n=3 Tax=unclassified Streptomyces TaxID=2593676 RepID=UPI00340E16F4